MKHPRIYLIGFMGAGKSAVGRCLARRLGWKYIDLDREIERIEGRTVAEVFSERGEPHFRNLERLRLKEVSKIEKAVIALGGGTFVDAENRSVVQNSGTAVWLKVSFPRAMERVKIDGTRPMFAGKDQARKLHQDREPFYALAKVHVSTDDRSPDSVAEEIVGVIRKL